MIAIQSAQNMREKNASEFPKIYKKYFLVIVKCIALPTIQYCATRRSLSLKYK